MVHLQAFILPFRLRQDGLGTHVQKPKIVVLLETSFKSHLSHSFVPWTAAAIFFGRIADAKQHSQGLCFCSSMGVPGLQIALFHCSERCSRVSSHSQGV